MQIEFSSPITAERRAQLIANKATLVDDNGESVSKGGKEVWQNRVKMAGEAYRIAKTIYTDSYDELDPAFPDWPTYRDNFFLDWISMRLVKSKEEAEEHFDKVVEEELKALEGEDTAVAKPVVVTMGDVPAVKRRGRPAGKRVVIPGARSWLRVAKKKVVAKKAGGNKSERAKAVVAMGRSRQWTRKRILEKLGKQLGIGQAYAATLYQKFS